MNIKNLMIVSIKNAKTLFPVVAIRKVILTF